jgi:hypothetical protein
MGLLDEVLGELEKDEGSSQETQNQEEQQAGNTEQGKKEQQEEQEEQPGQPGKKRSHNYSDDFEKQFGKRKA